MVELTNKSVPALPSQFAPRLVQPYPSQLLRACRALFEPRQIPSYQSASRLPVPQTLYTLSFKEARRHA